jgi:hypothetical protein
MPPVKKNKINNPKPIYPYAKLVLSSINPPSIRSNH